MSSRLEQIAIAVVTAGLISFGSEAYHQGKKDRQVETNTADIAEMRPQVNKIPVIETNQISMQRRLDTYEKLVIEGQKEILKEISAIRIDSAKQSTKIGAIEVDIKEINAKINN
ncbi:hypothetical protein NVP1087A_39 [Vibrio phage 1.087.A._10N.261.45.F9]|nr:hypothetical protein NVP1087A_39 [Vibrio phage 1.087.A._10N.261.45.F9]